VRLTALGRSAPWQLSAHHPPGPFCCRKHRKLLVNPFANTLIDGTAENVAHFRLQGRLHRVVGSPALRRNGKRVGLSDPEQAERAIRVDVAFRLEAHSNPNSA
jgi:hypothetical protein